MILYIHIHSNTRNILLMYVFKLFGFELPEDGDQPKHVGAT
jgi:hypothetical protein